MPDSHPLDLTRPARWLARTLAVLVVAVVLALCIGEGLAPAALRPLEWLQLGAIAIFCGGLLIGWRRETLGGAVALAALAAFVALELAANGTLPRGWVWPVMAVPGVLYLACAQASRAGSIARTR